MSSTYLTINGTAARLARIIAAGAAALLAAAWAGPAVTTATITVEPLQLLERRLCVSSAAGPEAAMECGDLRVAHALPGTRSRNRDRAPVLTYDSRSADAIVRIPASVALSGALPASVTATVYIGSGSYPAGSWNGSEWTGGARLITPTFSAGAMASGTYAYTLVISGDGQQLGSVNGQLFVVNRAASAMGAGWSMSGLEQLVPQGGSWTWIGGDGSARLYNPVVANSIWIAAQSDRPDTLKRVNGVLTRLLKGGAQVQFDEQGLHTRTILPAGDTTSFAYNSGRLTSITLPSPAPAPVYTLTYDGNGHLTQVTSPGARVTQVMRSGARVDSIIDPGGFTVRFGYVPQSWRINARTDRRGTTTSYTFTPAVTLASSSTPAGGGKVIEMLFAAAEGMGAPFTSAIPAVAGGRFTVLNGPRRDTTVTKIWIDRFGAPATIENALQQQTVLTRGNATFPALVTAIQRPNGFTTTATYDARGNPLKVIDQNPRGDGVNDTTSYEWNAAFDAVTRVVRPGGAELRMGYHGTSGNRLWEEDGRGAHTRTNYDYDGFHQLVLVTAPGANAATQVSYDARRNVQAVTSPLGATTWYVNDDVGRVRTVTTPLTLGIGSGTRIDSVHYDAAGRDTLTTSTGPGASYVVGPVSGTSRSLRLVVRTSFDAEDNVLAVSRESYPITPYGSTAATTSFTYDLANRKLSETDVVGRSQSWQYDAAGNPTKWITRRNHTLTMAYDALNRIVARTTGAVVYPLERCYGCVAEFFNVQPPRFPYFGQLGKFSQLDTNVTFYSDAATFTYDPATGGLRTALNRDARIDRGYYPNGALKVDSARIAVYNRWETPTGDPYGRHLYVLNYEYDRSGRRTRMLGGASVAGIDQRYSYEPGAGLLDSIADGAAGIKFLYDAAARRTERRINGTAAVELRGYNDDDHLVSRTVSAGGTVLYSDALEYDQRGKLTRGITGSTFAPLIDDVQAAYDGLGTLVANARVRSGAAWTDEYQVDAMGSVLRHDGNRAESHWRGTLSDYVSDRLIGTTALTGADVGHTSGWPGVTKVQDQAFSFDSSGNQRSGTVRAREYVANSDPAVYNDVLTGTSWSRSFYGADDRLRAFQRTGVDGTGMRTTFIEHRYDALGRRVLTRTQRDSTCSAGVPSCLSTIDRFVWDGDQLLAEHRINAPYTTQGEALEAEYSAGTLGGGGSQSNFLGAIRYTHGPGIDEPLVVWQSGDPFVPHANVRGGFEAGSRLDGSMLSMYWPALDRTAYHAPDVRAPAGSPTHWVGSLMDRQADASGLMYMRNRYYDPASGRFTQEDPIGLAGGLNLYGFAGGDPINFSDPFGLCPERPWECKELQEDMERPGMSPSETAVESQMTNRHIVAVSGMIASGGLGGRALTWLAGRMVRGGVQTRIGEKIEGQMGRRGWDAGSVNRTIKSPHTTRGATNKANGNPATAYFNKDGSHVVRDNRTGDVLQISNRNDPNWIPDRTIQNPYRP